MLELLAMIADRVRADDPAFANYPDQPEWVGRCSEVALFRAGWVGLHS